MGKYRDPQSANEAALQNILGEQNELREPQSPVEYYLQEIIKQGGGGGSGLPEVTSSDNGKVLKVEDGEWGKGDVSTTFVVDDYDSGDYIIPDTSFDDIYEAYQRGVVIISYPSNPESFDLQFSSNPIVIMGLDGYGNCHFVGRDATVYHGFIEDDGDGNVVFSVDPASPILPSVTASDNGKVLGVVNGEWAKTDARELKVVSAGAQLTTRLQQAFAGFLTQALQNPGTLTYYSTLAAGVTYNEIYDTIELIKDGYVVYFDGLDYKFSVTYYTETEGISEKAISLHYPLYKVTITGVGNINGIVDIQVASNGAVKIIGFAKTAS